MGDSTSLGIFGSDLEICLAEAAQPERAGEASAAVFGQRCRGAVPSWPSVQRLGAGTWGWVNIWVMAGQVEHWSA